MDSHSSYEDNTDDEFFQYQTIINLHESGISPEVISLQLDTPVGDVINIIRNTNADNRRRESSIQLASEEPKIGMINLDTIFDIDSAIEGVQKRIWRALKVEPKFNIPLEKTQHLLEKFAYSEITLVILHVDLVGSTNLSMSLPLKKLVTIIQAFTQEMSLLVEAYGGYVFKYVGDAILAFFFTKKGELHLPCINAISCAHSMIWIVERGINPILEENDYPEMGIRVGIDVGENMVVQYGMGTNNYTIIENKHNKNYGKVNGENNVKILKKPHLDILGYTISIASKMTSFAKPNQFIIGQSVYENLDSNSKGNFKELEIDSKEWNYLDPSKGNTYRLYSNLKKT